MKNLNLLRIGTFFLVISALIFSIAAYQKSAAVYDFTITEPTARIQARASQGIPPTCDEWRYLVPQTPEKVSKKYGIPLERIRMIPAQECRIHGGIYSGFEVRDGPLVTVPIPTGGSVDSIPDEKLLFEEELDNGNMLSVYSGSSTFYPPYGEELTGYHLRVNFFTKN